MCCVSQAAARGEDDTPVARRVGGGSRQASHCTECNFGVRFETQPEANAFVDQLAESVAGCGFVVDPPPLLDVSPTPFDFFSQFTLASFPNPKGG